MGLLVEYFAAPDDASAAVTIDWVGGPGVGVPADGRPGFPALDAPGIEPVVVLGAFEELLTGRTWEQQLADPDFRRPVAERDGGEHVVVGIDPPLVAAVVAAEPERLRALAPEWRQIEEFHGAMDAEPLLDFVTAFHRLCADAVDRGDAVYCSVVV